MLFWKSLCGTVLMVIVLPDDLSNASTMAAIARLGTSSEPDEPRVAVVETAELPPVGALAPVHAANTDPPPTATAAAATPRNRVRRPSVSGGVVSMGAI